MKRILQLLQIVATISLVIACGSTSGTVDSKITEPLVVSANTVEIDSKGNTPLMNAILKNSYSAFRDELSNGKYTANGGKFLNHENADGNTALHLATSKRNKDFINSLIEKGIERNAVNRDGDTALHIAVGLGDVSVIETLVRGGCDINVLNSDGATPLILAAKNGDRETVKTLLSLGADKKIKDNSKKIYTDYLPTEPEKKEKKDNIQEKAIEVQKKQPSETESKSSLQTTNGRFAVQFGTQLPPLVKAVKDRNRSKFLELLKAGENPNSADDMGNSALMYAVKVSDRAAATQLLDSGASVDSSNSSGQTPLMYAVSLNSDMVMLLLNKGAEPSVLDDERNSALSVAILKRSSQMISVLLDAGANPNITFNDGNSALIQMCYNSDLPSVRAFLTKVPEYDVWRTNSYGKTALDVANETHNVLLIKFLEQYYK